ncbi:hypothetical protein [Vibrio neptunius]|nr:hypothetical protein [Vibrio neptunius]QXX09527.1 hypothetical protein KW548_22345 [Vibrio neptunius]
MKKFICIALCAAIGVYGLLVGDFFAGFVMIAVAVFIAVVDTSEGKSPGPSMQNSYSYNDSSGGDSGGGDSGGGD